MQQVYRVIGAAAESKATVFITGESGTGKEVCALAIHEKSQRRDNEFVAINCAAIPRDLMESEIFGHVKGAFTGAHAAREGAASLASGGTLFLDELGEMDIDLQSKLLRFVQTGTFKKVGGSKLESVDVRFVCATNRDPLAQVARGEFREDLYYRLHVIPIELPPLRDRGSDALDIARNFLKCFAEEEEKSFVDFSLKTEAILSNYNWPGNIRQLQNVIRNVVVLNEGEQVLPEMLPPPLNGTMQTPTFVDDADDEFAITRFDLEQEKAIAAAAASTANDLHAQTSSQSSSQTSSQASNLIAAHASNPTVDQVLSRVPSETYIPPAALEIIQKLIVEKNQAMGEEHKIKALWAVEMEAIEEAIRICGDSIPKAAKYLEVSPSTIYRKRQAWKNIGYLQD
ncbi:MAG: hypothetical protein COA99_11370 [Moraxellaceae bacterium]|nr:MAG: hypothetical protein COA99_11370 [Moraxellaceae bacterium]